jgi:hypothetical protein
VWQFFLGGKCRDAPPFLGMKTDSRNEAVGFPIAVFNDRESSANPNGMGFAFWTQREDFLAAENDGRMMTD